MAKIPPAPKPRISRSPLQFSLLAALLLFTSPISSSKTITTSTITAAPTTSTSTAPPDFTDDKSFTSAILNSTNVYRANYNASALLWNDTLASFANDYLSSSAVGTDCKFAHSGGPYGENLALGFANATAAVEAWGDEGRKYHYGKQAGFSEATGHFTQLVWKNTSDVGCGRRLCGGDGEGKGWYLVCEYWPRGNVIGAFQDQVDRPVNSGIGIAPSGWLGFAVFGVLLWTMFL
ncbi:CAP domain-containing protein [Xylaria sp. FL0933]|nr:CAP domain-containing protein [Xylaria sp. FL0933]